MPDYALVNDERSGRLVAHRADCPEARKAADRGEPVMTMIDAKPLPRHAPVEQHHCLSRQRENV